MYSHPSSEDTEGIAAMSWIVIVLSVTCLEVKQVIVTCHIFMLTCQGINVLIV